MQVLQHPKMSTAMAVPPFALPFLVRLPAKRSGTPDGQKKNANCSTFRSPGASRTVSIRCGLATARKRLDGHHSSMDVFCSSNVFTRCGEDRHTIRSYRGLLICCLGRNNTFINEPSRKNNSASTRKSAYHQGKRQQLCRDKWGRRDYSVRVSTPHPGRLAQEYPSPVATASQRMS
jgi:hypothetical protein